MRELIFRAWDTKQKKMFYGVSIGTIKVWDENAPLISHEFGYSEDCIFEQYTGLKDKNGKEIYEGDIVKFDYGDSTPAIIVYSEGAYFLQATDDNSLFLDPESDKPCPMGWFDTVGLEVIGNIHENPELLEEEEEWTE